jgi:predicted RNase H-like HicB family nuclease
MRYPVAIEPGTETEAFGVVVPDLPGCFSAGDTMEEAIATAEETIATWIEVALDAKPAVPAGRLVSSLVIGDLTAENRSHADGAFWRRPDRRRGRRGPTLGGHDGRADYCPRRPGNVDGDCWLRFARAAHPRGDSQGLVEREAFDLHLCMACARASRDHRHSSPMQCAHWPAAGVLPFLYIPFETKKPGMPAKRQHGLEQARSQLPQLRNNVSCKPSTRAAAPAPLRTWPVLYHHSIAVSGWLPWSRGNTGSRRVPCGVDAAALSGASTGALAASSNRRRRRSGRRDGAGATLKAPQPGLRPPRCSSAACARRRRRRSRR